VHSRQNRTKIKIFKFRKYSSHNIHTEQPNYPLKAVTPFTIKKYDQQQIKQIKKITTTHNYKKNHQQIKKRAQLQYNHIRANLEI